MQAPGRKGLRHSHHLRCAYWRIVNAQIGAS